MKRLAVLAACLAALVFGLLALAEGETVIKGGSGLSAPSASFAPSAGQTIPVHLVGAQANEQEATEEFPFSTPQLRWRSISALLRTATC